MKHYDVIILGGGLAGLTLSIQLKRKKPDISILIVERRKEKAPDSAFKIGESCAELAGHYFREVLDEKEYLQKHELPKYGMRFFFPSHTKEIIESRVELGPRKWLYTPSHQIDRGTFENHLVNRTQEYGNELLLNASVKDVEFGKEQSTVIYTHNGNEEKATCRWVVDATSRFSFLKRKLGFKKPLEHPVSSVWWRLKGVVDVTDWSQSEEWRNYPEVKLRYLSTVHFMDKGYWIWIIPLGTKNTSIGIVADTTIHPFENFDTYNKAMEWLQVNEPLCYQKLEPLTAGKMDFKILKNFAHHSGRLYDGEMRWGVTGESGMFLDPLYSPGSDFIAINNTFLGDIILRELSEENVQLRALVYEQANLGLFESWIPIYKDKYQLMGNSQVMLTKILWDWAVYWSVPTLLFTNNAFADLNILKNFFSKKNAAGFKFRKLHEQMQKFFLDWMPLSNSIMERKYLDPVDLNYMLKFQTEIPIQHGDKLLQKIEDNITILEKVAAEIFRRVSCQTKSTPADMPVNPYTMDLNNPVPAPGETNVFCNEDIMRDIDKIWFLSRAMAQ